MTDQPKPLIETPDSELRQIAITLPGTRRPIVLAVPGDMTDSEWFSLVGMLPHIRDRLRRETTGILTVAQMPPGRNS